jgi:hypothetical protein
LGNFIDEFTEILMLNFSRLGSTYSLDNARFFNGKLSFAMAESLFVQTKIASMI